MSQRSTFPPGPSAVETSRRDPVVNDNEPQTQSICFKEVRFTLFFSLQRHEESRTAELLMKWSCLRRSSFAIYYTELALCLKAAQTRCIILELQEARPTAANDANANPIDHLNKDGRHVSTSSLCSLCSSQCGLLRRDRWS